MSRSRNNMSIRVRITLIAVIAVSAVLVLASLVLVVIQRAQLTSSIDLALVQRADDITALVATADPVPGDLASGQQEGFAQIVDETGQVISSTPNLSGQPNLAIGYAIVSEQQLVTVTGLAVDDDTFRVLSRTVDTIAGPAVLHVGATLDVVGESVAVLVGTLAVAVPVIVAVVGALVWWLVGRTLRPVEAIRSEVSGIGAMDLHRRVPVPAHHDEIGRLATTMNQMLERVEDSVRREQRFVADASHELRSPLTRMRAEIEVAQNAPAPDEDVLGSILEEVIILQGLVEGLLHLARADAGRGHPEMRLVDLDDLVFTEAGSLRQRADLSVDLSGVSGAEVLGDPLQLTRALRNLFDNARRHASKQVTITLVEHDESAILTVVDDGPGIAADQADRIFERFSRLDGSRSQATGGVGLGLAITRDIIERHQGTVVVDTTHGDGARFVVTLPVNGPPH